MLEVTPIAEEKLKEVLDQQDEKGSWLRVIAMPSGNGAQYMLTLEKETQEDDTEMQLDGIKFLMDSDSMPFLDEATIDFVEDLTRTGFVISNPKFASGGCGSDGCACGGHGCACGGH